PGHSGVDFPVAAGLPIRASGAGAITFRGWLNNNAGYSTIVDYDNGPTVLYCHQPGTAAIPATDTRVIEGSVIGEVGSSGNSTGPHLHLEIIDGFKAHTPDGIWHYFSDTE